MSINKGGMKITFSDSAYSAIERGLARFPAAVAYCPLGVNQVAEATEYLVHRVCWRPTGPSVPYIRVRLASAKPMPSGGAVEDFTYAAGAICGSASDEVAVCGHRVLNVLRIASFGTGRGLIDGARIGSKVEWLTVPAQFSVFSLRALAGVKSCDLIVCAEDLAEPCGFLASLYLRPIVVIGMSDFRFQLPRNCFRKSLLHVAGSAGSRSNVLASTGIVWRVAAQMIDAFAGGKLLDDPLGVAPNTHCPCAVVTGQGDSGLALWRERSRCRPIEVSPPLPRTRIWPGYSACQ